MTPSTNWADFMDALQSPTNDGIFTLAGQEMGRDTPPVPAPSSLRSSPSHRALQRDTPPPASDHASPKHSRTASPINRSLHKEKEGTAATSSYRSRYVHL